MSRLFACPGLKGCRLAGRDHVPFQTLLPPLAPQSTFSLVGSGCGASSWQRPLGITAPGPQVRFFRRCGDRSPGAAPGTGQEGVGWGQLLDTATHDLRSGRPRGQEDTIELESRSQALCSSSVCLQCPRPGWRVVAGAMARLVRGTKGLSQVAGEAIRMATSASMLPSCLIALSTDEMHQISLHGGRMGSVSRPRSPTLSGQPGFQCSCSPVPGETPKQAEQPGELQTTQRSSREQCPHHSTWLIF